MAKSRKKTREQLTQILAEVEKKGYHLARVTYTHLEGQGKTPTKVRHLVSGSGDIECIPDEKGLAIKLVEDLEKGISFIPIKARITLNRKFRKNEKKPVLSIPINLYRSFELYLDFNALRMAYEGELEETNKDYNYFADVFEKAEWTTRDTTPVMRGVQGIASEMRI